MTEPRAMMVGDAGPGNMGRVHALHFVGIGGAGMGGIAEVLLNLGYAVSGSDLRDNAVTERLRGLGIDIRTGHDAAHLGGADAVVVSSAVAGDNPEVLAARSARLPVVPRAEMLAELMRFRFGIAVAGTHGKTTTTSLLASLLNEAGHDPTYVIGGRLNSSASHARLGTGRYLVAEADESDASFLYLNPMMAVVTNIDADHLSTYEGDFYRLRGAFLEYLHHLPFYGLAVLCLDDPQVRALLPELTRSVRTYGFTEGADVRGFDVRHQALQTYFQVAIGDAEPFAVTLNLPGRHNARNALAAIAIADELGVPARTMGTALARFEGISRRFQAYGAADGAVMLVDDYGHHPHEIEAVFEAARAGWPERRLVVAFQPHRYSRTRELFEDFARVLSGADALVVTEVYPAGETALPGADGRSLCRAIRARGQTDPVFVADTAELCEVLPGMVHSGDLVLTLGAGSIGNMAATLAERVAAGGAA